MSTATTTHLHTEHTPVSLSGLKNSAELLGRILLAAMYLIAGVGKITAYSATAGYMVHMGVPGALLPLVIATELLGGLAIVLGYRTRVAAFLLGGFTVLAALIFHHDFANQIQQIMFLKDIAIAGAFLLLVAHGAGSWSLDHKAGRQ